MLALTVAGEGHAQAMTRPDEWQEITFEGGRRNPIDDLIVGLDFGGKPRTGGPLTDTYAEGLQRAAQEWFDQRQTVRHTAGEWKSEIGELGCEDFLENQFYGYADCLYVRNRIITHRKRRGDAVETTSERQRITYFRFVISPSSSTTGSAAFVRVYAHDTDATDREIPDGTTLDTSRRSGRTVLRLLSILNHLVAVDHRERVEKLIGTSFLPREETANVVFYEPRGESPLPVIWTYSTNKLSIAQQHAALPRGPGPRRANLGARLDSKHTCITAEDLFAEFPNFTTRKNVVRRHGQQGAREGQWDSVSLLDNKGRKGSVGAVFAYLRCAEGVGLTQQYLSTGEQ